MNVVVVLKPQHIKKLIKNKRVDSVATILDVSNHMIQLVSDFLEENTGYSNNPVTVFTRVFGAEGTLKTLWGNLSAIIDPSEGDFLIEMSVPDDMVVSISYDNYLNYKEEFKLTEGDDFEFLNEDFLEVLKLGDLRDEDSVISFIPFVDLKYCKKYFRVTKNWDIETDTSVKPMTDIFSERLQVF